MRTFTIASILALSALAAAQGEGATTEVAPGTETTVVEPGTEGTATTLAESPVEGISTASEGGESVTASAVDPVATGTEGGLATGGLPDSVQSFTSANGDAIASILSQQAVDPSAAASGARSLLSSGLANPEISSYIESNPTWSALAAQVTGAAGSTVAESDSQAVSSSASGSQSVVTSQVPSTKPVVSATHGAPKSADPSTTAASNSDEEGGAVSQGVKAGLALGLGAIAVALTH